MRRATALSVRTPEGIVFSLPLAGPFTRGLAFAVDLACVTAILFLARSALGLFAALSPDVGTALSIVAYFAVSIGYGIATEWLWRGQTLGKRLLSLRVVDAQGLKLQRAQVVIRNLLRPVDALPAFYLVGGVASSVTARGQRLGDLAANTVVVRAREQMEPDLEQVLPGNFNSLAAHPHLVARLRQRAVAAEASLALQAVLRRERLAPAARVQLFREMAAHFNRLVGFPAEATEGLSDEQYVRNVVDLLFRSARL